MAWSPQPPPTIDVEVARLHVYGGQLRAKITAQDAQLQPACTATNQRRGRIKASPPPTPGSEGRHPMARSERTSPNILAHNILRPTRVAHNPWPPPIGTGYQANAAHG